MGLLLTIQEGYCRIDWSA